MTDLETVNRKLDVLTENVNEMMVLLCNMAAAAPTPTPVIPAPTGGAYQFVRRFDAFGKGTPVAWADEPENVMRACAAVRWDGEKVYDDLAPALDAIWVEIDRLQAADPLLLPRYRNLDPAFACFGLLTGLFDIASYDSTSFGINSNKRNSYSGQTIEHFVQGQIDRRGRPGGPSGQ